MKRTWEQEKAYRAKRAEELKKEMDVALSENDDGRFIHAFSTSSNYMGKRVRMLYYRRYLESRIARRAVNNG